MMNHDDLLAILDTLIKDWESEVVEFKRGKKEFSLSDIGKYFSAIANEANLRAQKFGWLVFGIDDKTRQVIGTDYKANNSERIQAVSQQISQEMQPTITFRNIFELKHSKGSVVMFQIPAAPKGSPISHNGHHYARAGESLVALGLDKLNEINQQEKWIDWSAQVVLEATMDDLDPDAVNKAKQGFVRKTGQRFENKTLLELSDEDFLNKARLIENGKINRATLLLLGKPESARLLSPHPATMVWSLEAEERAYEHFYPPFLLTSTQLYQKIRNFQIRILPDDELIPVEIDKYNQRVVLEALHNCIAHQDYTKHSRIIVSEKTDRLIFESEGSFFDGKPVDYISGNRRPKKYRNFKLAQSMVQLNMIDTMGYGVHEMYEKQAKRYLPLPDYDLTVPQTVRLVIYGDVVDPAYSKLLIKNTDLSLMEIIALDRVQKSQDISKEMAKELQRKNLIEGRRPNYYVSSSVAEATNKKAKYIRNRIQDDTFYMQLILDFIGKYSHATRPEIDNLLLPKLSEILDEKQKVTKVGHLLTKLRKMEKIKNIGAGKHSKWVMR